MWVRTRQVKAGVYTIKNQKQHLEDNVLKQLTAELKDVWREMNKMLLLENTWQADSQTFYLPLEHNR